MTKDLEHTIFSPQDVSNLTYESILREQANPEHLNIGIPKIGLDFVMARKSKVIGLLGDTSQGKTSLMRFMASQMVKQIEMKSGEIGLFVTWEDNIEDFGMVDFANISKVPVKSLYNGQVSESEFDRVLKAHSIRSASPLWLAGHSEMSLSRPMLTMHDIFAICESLVVKQGRRIRFICLDYLQRIDRRDTGERDTRMQFFKIMDMVKNLALSYSTCVFIGSQVRRDMVEKAETTKDAWVQPQAHWAMETSNFEHSCDGIISIWMPYKSRRCYKVGDVLPMDKTGNQTVKVSKELMVVDILKQKRGETNLIAYLDFVPEYGVITEYGNAAKIREEYSNA